jgi:hypothetical protein
LEHRAVEARAVSSILDRVRSSSASAKLERRIGWTVVSALLAASVYLARSGAQHDRDRAFAERWLGPIATLAASVEWIRADLALRAADFPVAYARAETALEIEPSRTEAWIFLAHHFIFERASLGRELDSAERRAWVEAGLGVLDRGLHVSAEPAEIAFYRGAVFDYLAAIPDADRPWNGDARAALLEAAKSFDEAAALGLERASEYAELARTRAAAR